MIELKNIDLSKVSMSEQTKKIIEERNELIDALNGFYIEEDVKEHVIEEFWDLVQAYLGILDMYCITADEVMAGYPKHLEKIKHRPR